MPTLLPKATGLPWADYQRIWFKFHCNINEGYLINFVVSPETISHATKIPMSREMSFKVQKIKLQKFDEFLKEEQKGIDITASIPKTFLKENFSKILMVIQKYFTCEGRFNMVYQYHFKLLLHFTSKKPLDIPFYIFRSLENMADKVQVKSDASDTSIFHHSLIKLFVVEEINRLKRD